VDAQGNQTYYVYDAGGNTTARVDALSQATYFVYDSLSRQVASQDELGQTTYYAFDAVGNQSSVTSPLGNTAYFVYDVLKRRIGQVDPLGATTYYLYDAAGRQVGVIDPLGNPGYFQYDVVGRQIALTDALGNSAYFQYDAAGQQTVRLDQRGYPTYFAYDLAGRQSAVTDALGDTAYFVYDAAGRQTVQILPDLPAGGVAGGSPTYFVYDTLGRRLAVTDALGHTAYFQYDAAGQQTAAVDALGYVTYYYYDVLGRQNVVRDAAGGLVYYAYDALGRRTTLTDQRGNTSQSVYDAASRLVSELDPLGNTTYYHYDADGRLTSRTDGNGQTAYFAYDAVGRQIASAYADVAPVYFTYDAAGRRTLMLDEWGATYWTYDLLGRPTVRQDPRGTTVYYAYDETGRRIQLGVLGQGTAYYSYDAVGRMVSVLDGKTGLETTYDYDPAGRVVLQAHPNAATTYFSYDLAGRLAEKVTVKDADSSVLVRFAYTRDAAGNPISIQRESGLGVFYYQYDALQRLAYEGQSMGAYFAYENYYQYDLAGNRTLLRHGETGADNLTYYSYNAANEMLTAHDSSGWTYFSYDSNGNTVQEQKPSYTRYFDWDGRDMMTGVRSTETGWTPNVYRYDGLASRVSTLESIGLTYYDWDGINVIQEKAASNQVTDRMILGHASIGTASDTILMDKSTGSVYVPIADHVGTIWDLLNSSASVADAYSYDAFGVGRTESETTPNLYRFDMQRLGVSGDMYYFALGPYAPQVGRFAAAGSSYAPRFGTTAQPIAQGKAPQSTDKSRIMQAIKDYLDKLAAAGPIAECFSLKEFKTKLLSFLQEQPESDFEIVAEHLPWYCVRASACYQSLLKTMYVLPAFDPIDAIHEAMHFFVDRYDLYGNIISTPPLADESFAYAAENLLTDFGRDWGPYLGYLGGEPQNSQTCATMQETWYTRLADYSTRGVYSGHTFISSVQPEVHQSIPKGSFLKLQGQLSLKFDCECARAVVEPLLARIAGTKCCVSCSEVNSTVFGGTYQGTTSYWSAL
jgi:YD repeat-containing protein